jgi:hypothetical protein
MKTPKALPSWMGKIEVGFIKGTEKPMALIGDLDIKAKNTPLVSSKRYVLRNVNDRLAKLR